MEEYNFSSLIKQRTESKQLKQESKEQEHKNNNLSFETNNISTFEEVQGYNSSYINKNSLFDDIDCEFEYTTGDSTDSGEKNIFE